MKNSRQIRLSGKPVHCLAATLLAAILLLPALPAQAQDASAREILTTTALVPRAVGMALAGDQWNDQVSFAKSPNASGFLQANDSHLTSVNVYGYSDSELAGIFAYENELGLRANYGYEIGYKTTGENRYLVRYVRIHPFEPLTPRVEAYFIPTSAISLKEMQAMPVPDLLRFCRANTDRVMRDAPPGPMREYAVVAFSMDRLMNGAGWEIISTRKAGTSWSKGEWYVAVVDATLSVNGPEPAVFQAFHTMARKSPEAGKSILAATIVNQYVAPVPPRPATEVAVSPETRELMERFRSKALPNMKDHD